MIEACSETNARRELAKYRRISGVPVSMHRRSPPSGLLPLPHAQRRQDVPLSINCTPPVGVIGRALPRSSPAVLIAGAYTMHRHTGEHQSNVLSAQAVASSPMTHANSPLHWGSLTPKTQSRTATPPAPPGDVWHPNRRARFDHVLKDHYFAEARNHRCPRRLFRAPA